MPAIGQFTSPTLENRFESEGHSLFRAAIDPQTLHILHAAVEALRKERSFSGGLRRLVELSRPIADFVSSGALQPFLDYIGLPDAFLVRSILFDKTPESNWKVAWHQDTKIPVREKLPCEGFTAWSVKDGIIHAQPPARVLENMRTLRIHLDPTPAANGALRVVSASHRNGFLSASEIEQLTDRELVCECDAGDILAMSPLLLHASSPSVQAIHRRVIHLEFANEPLPEPLKWAIA